MNRAKVEGSLSVDSIDLQKVILLFLSEELIGPFLLPEYFGSWDRPEV